MRKLTVLQNQVSYIGLFSKPAFSLWGDGARILEGLYETFAPYKINLADFRQDSLSPVVADASVTVFVGVSGSYKFKFDRLELTLSNLSDSDLAALPEMLARGTSWLRATVSDFSFQTHLFTYNNHSEVSGGTAKDFLSTLPQVELPDVGRGIGNGVIFNWIEPKLERRVQLLIDHSNIHKDGLFIQLSLQSTADEVDYLEAVATGRVILDTVLAKVGLVIESED